MLADAHHRFVAEKCDWGFTRFHDLRKLYNAQDTQKRPIIEDESANVTVFVRVLKDPTGVLWHNFAKYLNSVLQCHLARAYRDLRNQLRLEKGNRLCRVKKPRGNMLYEFTPTIPLLHPLLPSSKL